MNHNRDEQFSKIIKTAIKPIGKREFQKDLWHQVEAKLPQPGISVSVFDWVLAALAALLVLLLPEAFFGLLAHL